MAITKRFASENYVDQKISELALNSGSGLPPVTENDNEKILQVVEGNWTLVEHDKGEKGDPFTYEDFTEEQLASLKGESFTYEDFTEEQLASLKGEPGANGQDGKSAYAYAQDAGYTGTEEEFAQKLANISSGNGSGLPEVSESDNNKILQVVNGAWALVDVVNGNTTVFYPDGNEVAY